MPVCIYMFTHMSTYIHAHTRIHMYTHIYNKFTYRLLDLIIGIPHFSTLFQNVPTPYLILEF